jgi:molybdate transport system ATP-binding protein
MMGLSLDIRKKVKGFFLDVSWEMDNDLTVLFGYSGAGKSMTLQMIAGLMEPDEGIVVSDGRVFFDSSSNINIPPQERSIGYVFQDLALFPHMTVAQNIQYGGNGLPKNEKNRLAAEMIEQFRLQGLENKLPSEVSGGQKQRVAFARALMRKPAMLLLDEPFSALDNPLRLEMRGLLKEIRSKFNIPVVLVTHDITEALTMADRLIVYSGGKVVQSGAPKEIYLNPATAEVMHLVHTMPEYPEFLHSFGLSPHPTLRNSG